MAIELKIPEVGESITEVEVGDWLKGMGEEVKKDEAVVTLESEKATVELPAPESGTITKVLKQKGEVAKVGEVIGLIEQNGRPSKAEPLRKPEATKEKAETAKEPAKPQPAEKARPAEKAEPQKEPQSQPKGGAPKS